MEVNFKGIQWSNFYLYTTLMQQKWHIAIFCECIRDAPGLRTKAISDLICNLIIIIMIIIIIIIIV